MAKEEKLTYKTCILILYLQYFKQDKKKVIFNVNNTILCEFIEKICWYNFFESK